MGHVCISLSPLDSDAHASLLSNKVYAVHVSVMGHGRHTESFLSRETIPIKYRAWEVRALHCQERAPGSGRGGGREEELT